MTTKNSLHGFMVIVVGTSYFSRNFSFSDCYGIRTPNHLVRQ